MLIQSMNDLYRIWVSLGFENGIVDFYTGVLFFEQITVPESMRATQSLKH